ncbi:DUF2946 family protein [Alcaligenaceae bacterium]|nr:DUF2946 family protein [Alcaligenaceae bacterium]
MDANVIAAMARWPDVPNAYGWLSLTESGQWRLHPRGDAWQPENSAAAPDSSHHDATGYHPGESISSPQILQFIDRNYACDEHGQWFFQNGPQKVYVRLDGAPYILHTMGNSNAGTLALRTHNDLDVKTVTGWLLDESGKLYVRTEYGPGLIAGRDLASVLDCIYTPQGMAILDAMANPNAASTLEVQAFPVGLAASDHTSKTLIRPTTTILFKTCTIEAVEQELGFLRFPRPTAN